MHDYHIHSNFSGDCDSEMSKMVEGAIRNKVKEICFTEHLDIDYTDPNIKFELDISKYFKKFCSIREIYKNDIVLKFGIELGIQRHLYETYEKIIKEHEFDFVIASIHTCNGKDLYNGDFFINITPEEAWNSYLNEVIDFAENFTAFNVIGHLDILKRYDVRAENFNIDILREKFITLFEILKNSGKGIEINTSGLRNSFADTLPSRKILEWYHESGSEIITIGSDSHFPDNVGYGITDAKRILKDIGFKKYCIYDKMNPNFVDLVDVI